MIRCAVEVTRGSQASILVVSVSGGSIQCDRRQTQGESKCGADDRINLGLMSREGVHVEMGTEIRWFHEKEVVPGYLGECLGLRVLSVDVPFHGLLVQKRTEWHR